MRASSRIVTFMIIFLGTYLQKKQYLIYRHYRPQVFSPLPQPISFQFQDRGHPVFDNYGFFSRLEMYAFDIISFVCNVFYLLFSSNLFKALSYCRAFSSPTKPFSTTRALSFTNVQEYNSALLLSSR